MKIPLIYWVGLERSKEPGFLQSLVEFVYPPLCAGCGIYTPNASFICDRCLAAIDQYTDPFCTKCRHPVCRWPECEHCGKDTLPLFAYGDYVDPLKQIVIELKFRSVRAPVNLIVTAMAETFEEKLAWCEADMLIPIPLHPSRQYSRGYNQAEYIAETLGECLELPVSTGIIARTARRKPQQMLPAAKRAKNVKGVFSVISPTETETRILLVDDVVTSGQTALEASRELSAGGYTVAGIVSLAHGQ